MVILFIPDLFYISHTRNIGHNNGWVTEPYCSMGLFKTAVEANVLPALHSHILGGDPGPLRLHVAHLNAIIAKEKVNLSPSLRQVTHAIAREPEC